MESTISDACADPEKSPPPPPIFTVARYQLKIPEVNLISYMAKVCTHCLPLASLRKDLLKCEHCLNCLHMKF